MAEWDPSASPAEIEDDLDLDEFAPLAELSQSRRLAGAGGALGGCVGVMTVVLAVGTARSVSGPATGFAAAPQPEPALALPEEGIEPGPAAPGMSADQVAMTQQLSRAVIEARAEVQAAETRLAMLRATSQRRALSRAERALQRASDIESQGSSFDWIDSQSLADRTRDRAREQLSAELAPLAAGQQQAEAELDQLRLVLEVAEDRLAAFRIHDSATPQAASPPPREPDRPERRLQTPAATVDLLATIQRHRARLLAGESSSSP